MQTVLSIGSAQRRVKQYIYFLSVFGSWNDGLSYSRYSVQRLGSRKDYQASKQKGWTERKKNFNCHLCHKSFRIQRELTSHMNVKHYKCRPYQCPLCNHGYSNSHNLEDHIKKAHPVS